MYYPVGPGAGQGATLLVRVKGGDPERFIPRLRDMAAALDPELRLGRVRSMSATETSPVVRLVGAALVLVLSSVLLLSAAGIHAMMSFTVTQRGKEIGIRTALGARPRRLLATIFSRALRQLALGGAVGAALGLALLEQRGSTQGLAAVLLAAVTLMMIAAGVLATLGPAWRALRIRPMEALRNE